MATMFLVSCVGMKAAQACAAADLYTSPWFRKARAYVEARGSSWAILSAEHGLVQPAAVVAPYNRTLNTMTAPERRSWAQRVAADLIPQLAGVDRVVFLAGSNYREHLVAALRSARPDLVIDVPMAGLGIGEQLHYLTEAA